MPRTHPVKEYVRRISIQDLEEYPSWDITKALPRLPVPDLQTTLDLYLKLMAPIVSEEELERTTQLTKEFGIPGGLGEKLQQKLEECSETQDNWVNKWWLDDMYLKNPLALPLNSNPGMVFPRQQFASDREQLRFAAQLISGILDYKTIIDSRGLPVDRARHSQKGQPMCMEQYYRLFSSYRYPGVESDNLETTQSKDDPFDPEHILVICRDQLFKLPVSANGNRLGEEDLYNQLRRIEKQANEDPREASVGILTALPRNKWAEIRERLLQEPSNKVSFEAVENCIFALCLDKPVQLAQDTPYEKLNKRAQEDIVSALQMLHGCGVNEANRWYDKTMQFIISGDGNCGLNYEHSVAEGIAVIRLIEHILQYMEMVKARRLQRFPSICDQAHPQKLLWKIDSTTLHDIEDAKLEVQQLAENLDLHILRFEKFGRDFPKTVNMSPDSFIQLALQLTHYKIHKYLVPTYESASIRRFALGRVDNIRAASIPALEWCKAMVGEIQCSDKERIALLRKAMDWQTEVMLQTILGKGVDNHLLGLREIAASLATETGQEMPAFFLDSTYKKSNQFRLSTSQVPTSMDTFICYGAVVPNGYGAAYNPHKNYIVVAISCWRNCPEIRADRFAEALDSAFCDMYELMKDERKMPNTALEETNEGPVSQSEANGIQDKGSN